MSYYNKTDFKEVPADCWYWQGIRGAQPRADDIHLELLEGPDTYCFADYTMTFVRTKDAVGYKQLQEALPRSVFGIVRLIAVRDPTSAAFSGPIPVLEGCRFDIMKALKQKCRASCIQDVLQGNDYRGGMMPTKRARAIDVDLSEKHDGQPVTRVKAIKKFKPYEEEETQQ